MSDYISRDTAVNGLAKIINESNMPEEWNKGMSTAMSALFRIPTADVRPVITCGECKHWFENGTDYCSCDRDALLRERDFFCAAGEKREES